MRPLLTLLATTLVATLPIAARAQDAPTYAVPNAGASADEQIHGRIVDFDGAYDVRVDDERGFVDRVRLHDGTIINPTGLTLAPGMIVSVLGYNAGGYFSANEIDTPYTSYDGGWYYRDHPYDYYGSTVGFSFFFGDLGWWHGPGYRGYGYGGGGYGYGGRGGYGFGGSSASGGRRYGGGIRGTRQGGFSGRQLAPNAGRADGGHGPSAVRSGGSVVHGGGGGSHGGGSHAHA